MAKGDRVGAAEPNITSILSRCALLRVQFRRVPCPNTCEPKSCMSYDGLESGEDKLGLFLCQAKYG